MKCVITIGGLHGTGKSSVADRIAAAFGLRRVSAGVIFRNMAVERGMTLEEFSRVAEGDAATDRLLDDTLRAEAAKGTAVIDGQLAAWMAGENSDLNILLTAPLDVRVARIAQRDGRAFEDSRRETVTREGSERARYLEYYGVDVADMSVYDIILNTAKYSLEDVIAILRSAIERLFAKADD